MKAARGILVIGFSVALIAAACGDDDGTSLTATQDGNGTMRVINFKVSMSQVADTPALPPLTFERRAENDNSWMIINVTPKVIFGWEDGG
ncbi:MAG: hypothetical protein IH941_11755 [Acidobacteria bacterium]|nr:hypothetical protein [Acidobacteriota bacterium]